MQPAWWQSGVIYQVYPRSFMDSNGDGVGDLPGLLARLDYVQWLGVDAIWLSPVYPSPMADFGYDVADFENVDPVFGTLQDLNQVIEQAHARGLKVILDYVPNHSSDEHPWFQHSRLDRTSTRLNSSHVSISYAVFCLTKKNRASYTIRTSRSSVQDVK